MTRTLLIVFAVIFAGCTVRIEPLVPKQKRHPARSQHHHHCSSSTGQRHSQATRRARSSFTVLRPVSVEWFARYLHLERRFNYWIPEDAEIRRVNGTIAVPRASMTHYADMEAAAGDAPE